MMSLKIKKNLKILILVDISLLLLSIFKKNGLKDDSQLTNNRHSISLQAKKLYPEWIIRIYHDSSIEESIDCEIECLKDVNSKYLDNVDFCNIEKTNMKLEYFTVLKSFEYTKMHAMMWRWLPIADLFVDIFSSRDIDSVLLQREVDSVNTWLNSTKVGHMMRDHKHHGSLILGGMWGFHNKLDRNLAQKILNLMENTAKKYNPKGMNKKQGDQSFLANYVYSLIKNKSVIHDSYNCKQYKDSVGFPSKRKGSCFIGGNIRQNQGDNESCKFKKGTKCPVECRPKNHKDWEFC